MREQQIGDRYRLEACVATSGRRRVWRGYDRVLRRAVAVKGAFGPPGLEEVVEIDEEFFRLRHLEHPRIARVLDLAWGAPYPAIEEDSEGTTADPVQPMLRFFTQTWFTGPSLQALAGRLSLPEVRQCLVEVLEVVAWLHHRRMTRLDLKPEHLIRTESGWRLIDLDQAREMNVLGPDALHAAARYAAPEVLIGSPGDPRSDLFSLGATLYEALTGSPPDLPGNTLEEAGRWLRASAVPALPPAVYREDPVVARLVERLLARAPAERPGSAEEVLEMLELSPIAWRRASPAPEPTLVGRQEALQHAQRLIEEADVDKGGALCVLGRPGSGRSRLLRELCDGWRKQGRPIVNLEAASEPPSPLGLISTLRDLLESIEASQGGDPIAVEGPSRPRVTLTSHPVDAKPAQDDEARESLVRQALGRVLEAGRAAAQRVGRVIPVILEASEPLDELSAAVLSRLRLLLPESGLLLVSIGPVGAMDGVTAGEAARDRARPGGGEIATGTAQILLEPIDLDAARTMAEQVLGAGGLSGEELAHVWTAAHGLPGRVYEAMALRWRDPDCSLDQWIPMDAPEWVAAQLPTWPEAMIRCAHAAAVLAPEFTIAQLTALLEDDPGAGRSPAREETLAHVALLLERGLISSGPGDAVHETRFRFSSESRRCALEARLDEDSRLRLHRKAAEVLEETAMSGIEVPATTIARHFLAAGLGTRARPYLFRGLEAARKALCLEEAAWCLRSLLGTYGTPAMAPPPLHFQLGELEYELSRYSAARVAFANADQDRGTAIERARAAAGLARAEAALGAYGAAGDALARALELKEGAHPGERTRWLHLRVWLALRTRRLDDAEAALASARATGLPDDPKLRIDHVYFDACLGVERGNSTTMLIDTTGESLEVARHIGYRKGIYQLLQVRAELFRREGRTDDAARCMEASIGLSRAAFDVLREAAEVANLGRLYRETGEAERALECFQRAERLHSRLGHRSAAARNALSAADLVLEHDRIDAATELLDRAAALLSSCRDDAEVNEAWLAMSRGRSRLRLGQLEGLREAFARVRDVFAAAHQRALAFAATADLMELALEEGRPQDALSMADGMTGELATDRLVRARVHRLAARAHQLLASQLTPSRGLEPPAPLVQKDAGLEPAADPVFWLERLTGLLEVARDEETLAVELARLVADCFEGRGCALLAQGDSYALLGARERGDGRPDEFSDQVCRRVFETRAPFVCDDVYLDRTLAGSRSLRATNTRSVICWPVLSGERCVGAIYVAHPRPARFAGRAAAVMERVASLASGRLAELARRRNREAPDAPVFEGLVGDSAAMRLLRRRMQEVLTYLGTTGRTILLGETGTGKSKIAEILHKYSGRRGKLVTVNCPALPEGIFESEVFGHAAHAFGSVKEARPGYLLEARGGTLFFDEIESISLSSQAKLLTVLQNREFERLGDHRKGTLDALLIFAANEDPRTLVKQGRLREDFYARIRQNPIDVPTLRSRGPEDISELIVQKLREHLRIPPEAPAPALDDYFTRRAQRLLFSYDWPRNVRQLHEHVLEDAGVLRRLHTGERIDAPLLEMLLELTPTGGPDSGGGALPLPPPGLTYGELSHMTGSLIRAYCRRQVELNRNNMKKTAKQMRMGRTTLYKVLELDDGVTRVGGHLELES